MAVIKNNRRIFRRFNTIDNGTIVLFELTRPRERMILELLRRLYTTLLFDLFRFIKQLLVLLSHLLQRKFNFSLLLPTLLHLLTLRLHFKPEYISFILHRVNFLF